MSVATGYERKVLSGSLRDGGKKLKGDVALALLAPLGLEIDRILSLPELNEEQRRSWVRELATQGDGVVTGCDLGAAVPDPSIVLGLFIRFRALDEL